VKALRAALLAVLWWSALGALVPPVHAQGGKPIRIGLSMAQTGPLSAAGKSGLLALQLWREDVNARGGLLGRPVALVVYDDQSNPALTPGIYTKLLDVDKVDLLIAPYATNLTAPLMPLVKQRDRLLIGNFALDVNAGIRHDKYFNIQPWGSAREAVAPFLGLCKKLGAKTAAILAADAEFAQNIATAARGALKEHGLQAVYDQNYPPSTVDFSSMLRAVRAKKPDAVFVASYPADSAAIIRAVNEIGVGDSVKLFGGGMVGLQYATLQTSLGPMLNGIVNYDFWVPEPTLDFPGIQEFLAKYEERAEGQGVDPLGHYLPPWSYAYMQVLGDAVEAVGSLDQEAIADYIRDNEFETVVGPVKFGPNGEWATSRVLMVQFQNIENGELEQFKHAGKRVVLLPEEWASGEFIFPYTEAKK